MMMTNTLDARSLLAFFDVCAAPPTSTADVKDLVAGLGTYLSLFIVGSVGVIWLLSNHYLMAGLVGGAAYLAYRNPGWATAIAVGTALPLVSLWVMRHWLLSFFLLGAALVIYGFADDDAKIRMNVSVRRFAHALRPTFDALASNTSVVAGNVREQVQTVS